MKIITPALILLALALAGCGSGDSGNGTKTGNTATTPGSSGALPGGEADFVFASLQDHNYLDPQKMTWDHDMRVAGCLYERLVRYKLPECTIIPGVAQAWEISDDKLTYTFHLRPEARWSNGDPVTANDFIFAWRRALLPDSAFDYTQLFFRIAGAQDFYDWRAKLLASPEQARSAWPATLARFKETVGLAAPDDHTLVIHLAQPTAYFMELCAFFTFAPNPAKVLEPLTVVDPQTGMVSLESRYWSDPEHLVTNGPYVLKRRRFKQDLLMEQNPNYWDRASMANHSILEKIIEQSETQLLAYDQGQVDWLPDIPTASRLAADLVTQKRPDVRVVPWAGTYYYNVNCQPTLTDGRKNPLADPRVRRALSMGIDRQTIVREVTRLNQPVARTFIPPGSLPGYEPPVEDGATYDIEQAKKLLAEAGYPDGKGLNGLTILYNTNGSHQDMAQFIQRTWQDKLGVVVTLESIEEKAFGERLRKHEFTIARSAWMGDYRDPTTFLDKCQSTNGNNDAGWSNPQFDDLLAQAAKELDTAKRLALLRQAESVMVREQPIIPIFHVVTMHVFDPKKVLNLNPNTWNFRRLELVKVQR